jgi:hypothetical protein
MSSNQKSKRSKSDVEGYNSSNNEHFNISLASMSNASVHKCELVVDALIVHQFRIVNKKYTRHEFQIHYLCARSSNKRVNPFCETSYATYVILLLRANILFVECEASDWHVYVIHTSISLHLIESVSVTYDLATILE